ncbi:hypothetical protein ACSFBI_31570, partial [Variovorax sp. RB3P1]|uniref:hypothetical protein n=1 Tax=Variovorax sp. RB3P1 TaxID=3443732 RepID=UPI003F466355
FLLPACSASAKLIWLIALAPLQGSALHARNVLLIRPSLGLEDRPLFRWADKTMATTAAIQSAELVAFLQDSSDGKTKSIIIESERPAVSAPSYLGQKIVSSTRHMLPPPATTLLKRRARKVNAAAPVTMADIEQALKRLGLDCMARRNDLSGSFVVEATAEQIRELAATHGVQAIRPNRRHRNIAS